MLQHYSYGDIFVLAPSIRSESSPVRRLENKLVNYGILCHVPASDDDIVDPLVTKGKISFMTYHQAKGLQRPVVIVYNFSDDYFDFYSKQPNVDRSQLPNTMYVACTRAMERLFVIQHSKSNALHFLPEDQILSKVASVKGQVSRLQDTNIQHKAPDLTVTSMTRHLSDQLIDQIMPFMKFENVNVESDSHSKIKLNPRVLSDVFGTQESVSNITGIAVPAMYEYKNKKTCSLIEIINQISFDSSIVNELEVIQRAKEVQNRGIKTFEDMLLISTVFEGLTSGYIHKIRQISDYNWVAPRQLKLLMKRAELHLSSESEFEKSLTDFYVYKNYKISIKGRVDVIDRDTLWEIKCINTMTEEHELQLLVYCWLSMRDERYKNVIKKFKLLNLCDGKVRELDLRGTNVDVVMEMLIKNKLGQNEFVDINFFEQAKSIREKTVSIIDKPLKDVYYESYGVDEFLLQ
ncbi:hypothetical protein AKO1_015298 [Acrasis kona]|uniref:UvrD-like helicase C-terminal domain-containing protein n=1 Tax=Acrasis kona TaxID=1008807 RepID=A0AAW2ZH35_9EUKA